MSVDGPSPFQGTPWETAKKLLGNDRQGPLVKADDPACALSNAEYRKLATTFAATKGTAAEEAAEKQLLKILANPQNVNAIVDGLSKGTPFVADGMKFADADPAVLALAKRAYAGKQIKTQYQPGPRDYAALQKTAAETKVDMSSQASRDEALKLFVQAAQGVEGKSSCNGTSFVALAFHAGPEALKNLGDAVKAEWKDPADGAFINAFLAKMEKNELTLKDLGDFAQVIYKHWDADENSDADIKNDHSGVSADTMQGFSHKYRTKLSPMFKAGEIVGIDNRGDTKGHHAVARFYGPDGKTTAAFYDPGLFRDGSSLRTGKDIPLYEKASTMDMHPGDGF